MSDLQEAEKRSQERLQNLRKMFQAITDKIRQAESKPPITRQPRDKHSAVADERPAAGEESRAGEGKGSAGPATVSEPKDEESETAKLPSNS